VTTTEDDLENDPTRILTAVVWLLFRAADQEWTQATLDGPTSPRHLLGLQLHFAASQGLDLLPDYVDLEAAQGESALEFPGTDPAELLRTAERLTRSVPIEAFPAGTSMLVVALCDLVRESTP